MHCNELQRAAREMALMAGKCNGCALLRMDQNAWHGTTIVCVRKDGMTVRRGRLFLCLFGCCEC